MDSARYSRSAGAGVGRFDDPLGLHAGRRLDATGPSSCAWVQSSGPPLNGTYEFTALMYDPVKASPAY